MVTEYLAHVSCHQRGYTNKKAKQPLENMTNTLIWSKKQKLRWCAAASQGSVVLKDKKKLYTRKQKKSWENNDKG